MKRKINFAIFVFVATFLSIAILGFLALITRHPLIFPSLGPTAFLLFSSPRHINASPKHTILGHLIGILCGYLALVIFGLTSSPSILTTGVTLAYIGAAAFSLSLTSFLMIALSVTHPPAGATTLIISLGILHSIGNLFVLFIGVVLLCFIAWILNNSNGYHYPLWSPHKPSSEEISTK